MSYRRLSILAVSVTLLAAFVGVLLGLSAGQAATGCVFSNGSQPAFCDTFDAPAGTGNRSGDLNGDIWGVSRSGSNNPGQGWYGAFPTGGATVCGQPIRPIEQDIRICNGQLQEGVSDQEDYSVIAMYPKQPFDFAGRTGTVVFDVNADSHGPHAAWPEFVITDRPAPAPDGSFEMHNQHWQEAFGFSLSGDVPPGGYCGPTQVSVPSATIGQGWMAHLGVFSDVPFTTTGCVAQPPQNSQTLNHFEVRISTTRVEVWGTDPGQTVLKQLGYATPSLGFSRGLIWINDVHYNGCKDGDTQCIHTFTWDNVGFDGPFTYRDLAFDVLDSLTPEGTFVNLGWGLPSSSSLSLNTLPLSGLAGADSAILTLDLYSYAAPNVDYRLNGGPWHTFVNPHPGFAFSSYPLVIPVALSELVDGAPNQIELKQSGNTDSSAVWNVDIILVAAIKGGPTSTPTASPPSPTATSSATPTPPATQSATPTPTVATATPTATATATSTPTPSPAGTYRCQIRINGNWVNVWQGNGGRSCP